MPLFQQVPHPETEIKAEQEKAEVLVAPVIEKQGKEGLEAREEESRCFHTEQF